jgi:DNA-binding FrmR family transcriptional regulator
MLMNTQTRKEQIINHVSRLEGQLASIKEELSKEKPDCLKASKTLLSSARSFAGLREKFVETFLLEHVIEESKMKNRGMFDQLLTLIKG